MFHVEHFPFPQTDLYLLSQASIKRAGSGKVRKFSAVIWIDLHNKLPYRNLSRRAGSQNTGSSYQNSFRCNPPLPYIYLKTRQLMPSTGGRRFNISVEPALKEPCLPAVQANGTQIKLAHPARRTASIAAYYLLYALPMFHVEHSSGPGFVYLEITRRTCPEMSSGTSL